MDSYFERRQLFAVLSSVILGIYPAWDSEIGQLSVQKYIIISIYSTPNTNMLYILLIILLIEKVEFGDY